MPPAVLDGVAAYPAEPPALSPADACAGLSLSAALNLGSSASSDKSCPADGESPGALSRFCAAFSRAFISTLIFRGRHPAVIALDRVAADSGGTCLARRYRVWCW